MQRISSAGAQWTSAGCDLGNLFLAGTPADRITGTVSPVDGGVNAGQHAR